MIEDAVITAPGNGVTQIVVNNCSGVTQCVPEGVCLGEAEMAQVLPESGEDDLEVSGTATVKWTPSKLDTWRKEKLLETLQLPELPSPSSGLLRVLLTEHHNVF